MRPLHRCPPAGTAPIDPSSEAGKPDPVTRSRVRGIQVHDLKLLRMRKAENREARRIIDAAAEVAVGIDEDEVADRGWRLAAEPAIYQRAGAFRQRETVHSLAEVPPGGLTTSSGRRPTKGPVGLGAPSSTSDLSGSPTHTESSRPSIPAPRSSSLKGRYSSRPSSCFTTTAVGPLTSATTRSSGGRGGRRPSALTSGCSIPSRFRTGIRGAPLGMPTRPTSSRPHRPVSPKSSSTTIRLKSGTPRCRASPAPPRGAGPQRPATGTAGSTRAPSSPAISTSCGPLARRHAVPGDLARTSRAMGPPQGSGHLSAPSPAGPLGDLGPIQVRRPGLVESLEGGSGFAHPARRPQAPSGLRTTGVFPCSTLTSGHAGAGSGSRAPDVSWRRAARRPASTSANGWGARTRTCHSPISSTASRSPGWARRPRTRTSA